MRYRRRRSKALFAILGSCIILLCKIRFKNIIRLFRSFTAVKVYEGFVECGISSSPNAYTPTFSNSNSTAFRSAQAAEPTAELNKSPIAILIDEINTLEPNYLDTVEIPECFLCGISQSIMEDPVFVSTGRTFDRGSIEPVLLSTRQDPITREPLTTLLIPNVNLRSELQQFLENLKTGLRSKLSMQKQPCCNCSQ